MKRIMKILLKTAIVLLLLPLFIVYALFIYAKYINPSAEDTMKEMTEFMERRKLPGNGFGGEEGMIVIDSDYRSEKYFLIDNERQFFVTVPLLPFSMINFNTLDLILIRHYRIQERRWIDFKQTYLS